MIELQYIERKGDTMKRKKKIHIWGFLFLLVSSLFIGCQSPLEQDVPAQNNAQIEVLEEVELDEQGIYISKEEVAAYIHQYERLPDNFITKKEAKALGWVSTERNLAEVAPGKCIGGDYFGNYEGLLPEEDGRNYYECDINSVDGNRGAERIVYSNDGLIYYTPDHYESFELLYGEE